MLDAVFYAAAFGIVTTTVVFAVRQIKLMNIGTTVVINRQTDDGESLTVQASFPKSITTEQRQEEIQKLFAHTDERKKFTHERFMALLETERAKQAGGSNLKSV